MCKDNLFLRQLLEKKLFKVLVMWCDMHANGRQGAMKLLGNKNFGHHKHCTLNRSKQDILKLFQNGTSSCSSLLWNGP